MKKLFCRLKIFLIDDGAGKIFHVLNREEFAAREIFRHDDEHGVAVLAVDDSAVVIKVVERAGFVSNFFVGQGRGETIDVGLLEENVNHNLVELFVDALMIVEAREKNSQVAHGRIIFAVAGQGRMIHHLAPQKRIAVAVAPHVIVNRLAADSVDDHVRGGVVAVSYHQLHDVAQRKLHAGAVTRDDARAADNIVCV